MLTRFGYGLQKSGKGLTDIDFCWRQRKAAEENKSVWELMETNFLAFLSHASKFFKGMEALPLLDRSRRDASASNCGMLSVGKYWFWLWSIFLGARTEIKFCGHIQSLKHLSESSLF